MVKATLLLLVLLLVVRTHAHLTGKGCCCNGNKILDTIQKVMSRDCRPPGHKNFFVAFDATLTRHITSGTKGKKIIFDKVQTNIGNHYSSGVFTVPRNGVYQFQWNILGFPGKYSNTCLVVDNKVMKRNNSDSRSSGSHGHKSGSAAAILELRRGNRVWIQTCSGYSNSIYGGNWSSFQGLILQAN